MHLTPDEQAILDGSQGKSKQKAMKLLAGLGEFYKADKLIQVSSVQVSGVSYKTGGEALISVLEEFANEGIMVETTSFLNPAGMDLVKWKEMGVTPEFAEKQKRIVELYTALGIQPTCSCTPYNIVEPPHVGEHVAWAESSAVSYCNSVLGARTNREGSLSALASAMLGKTPNYGLHLDENRKPTVVVELDCELESGDLAMIGRHVGTMVKSGIPYFKGIAEAKLSELKGLGAAMAATGSVALYHVEHITPEADGFDVSGLEVISIDENELDKIKALSRDPKADADLVFFGCPHLGEDEVEHILELLHGRHIREGVRMWLFVPRALLKGDISSKLDSLTTAGVEIFADSCCVVAPLDGLFKGIVTNSGKAAFYLKNLCDTKPVLMTTQECVDFAVGHFTNGTDELI